VRVSEDSDPHQIVFLVHGHEIAPEGAAEGSQETSVEFG